MTLEGESARATIRVMLADDHPVVRRGLAALLGTLHGVTVVAEASDGEEALRKVELNRPDVVVMDRAMVPFVPQPVALRWVPAGQLGDLAVR